MKVRPGGRHDGCLGNLEITIRSRRERFGLKKLAF
jgi:hypothetical protein